MEEMWLYVGVGAGPLRLCHYQLRRDVPRLNAVRAPRNWEHLARMSSSGIRGARELVCLSFGLRTSTEKSWPQLCRGKPDEYLRASGSLMAADPRVE